MFLTEAGVAWFLPKHGQPVRAKLIVTQLCESPRFDCGERGPILHDLDCLVECDDGAEELARVVKDQMLLEAGNDSRLRVK